MKTVAKAASTILPTLVCAWCKVVIRLGTPKLSHGICRACAAESFGKLRPAALGQPRTFSA